MVREATSLRGKSDYSDVVSICIATMAADERQHQLQSRMKAYNYDHIHQQPSHDGFLLLIILHVVIAKIMCLYVKIFVSSSGHSETLTARSKYNMHSITKYNYVSHAL